MNMKADAPEEAPREAEITLRVLAAIEADSAATQRSIAQGVGIALGLANAYLKRCARKGWIKVQQVPANRYTYYLTPRGFAEKGRLTREYLRYSFDFFRSARAQCSETFADCARREWRRVVLAGASDLSEIATLCAAEHGVQIIGILDAGAEAETRGGIPVIGGLGGQDGFDAVMLTDLDQPQASYEALIEWIDPDRVLTPPLLNVSRVRPNLID